MPIQKYRSAAEMPRIPSCEPLSDEGLARIRQLWARSSAMSPRIYPRGVFKFRSIEEAQAARDRVTQENVRRIEQERQRASRTAATNGT
jgi:hypothetical protein